jgi:K319-like protein
VSGALTAFAVVVPPANTGGLVAVGPVSGDNGFPVWYKDSNGVRLEGCLDGADPLCAFVPGVDFPDANSPISFPNNFPEEFFYQLASNTQDVAGGAGRAVITLALEGAFGSGPVKAGDQMVFARIRIRLNSLQPGATYTITHPYGVDQEVAEADGTVNFTEDVGLAPGVFTGALDGRIGPFLKWDPAVAPAAPVGYIGDPNVDHQVVGSPFSTNFVRVQGPGLAVIGNQTNLCSPATTDCIESNLFSLLGKKATKAGFDIQRAVYTRNAGTGGTIDVFATSDTAPQSIQVEGEGVDPVLMRGENGNYVAHFNFTGSTVPQLTIKNVSDAPPTVKTTKPGDIIKGTAVWNADDQTLTVNATSSDTFAPPLLTARGFGDLANGALVANNVVGPPANVLVTSDVGGSVTLPVQVTGAAFDPLPVQAFAGEDQDALQGNLVTLDGSGSTGPITSFAWTQTGGPAVTLNGASTATPTFTAPTGPATLEFELTVNGSGGPSTDRVVVNVLASAPVPIADAGPDQTVNQTATVTLDGTGSQGATNLHWQQTGGPTVSLSGATTAHPTFAAPKQNVALTFELTASNAGGSSTDTVEISVNPDDITVTRAEYRIGNREWRIEGTDTIFGPGVSVTIYLGPTAEGAPLATNVAVDTVGAWSFRQKPSNATPGGFTTITVVSSGGDQVINFPLTISN